MYRLKQLLLIIMDVLLLYVGLYVALIVRAGRWPGQNFLLLLAPMTQLFIVAVLVNFIVGLYDLTRAKNTWGFYRKIIVSGVLWMGLGIVYFYINPRTKLTPKTTLLLATLAGYGFIALWRSAYNRYLSTGLWKARVLFTGITAEALELIIFIKRHPEFGYAVAGVIAPAGATLPAELTGVPTGERMTAVSPGGRIDYVVLSPEAATDRRLRQELYSLLFQQVSIVTLSHFYEQIFGRVPPFTFSEGWFLTNLREQEKRIYDRARILTDDVFALFMGVFFILTFPFIALLIRLTSSGTIFFRQERVGRLERPFTMYKYRTMLSLSADGSAELEGPEFARHGDERITLVGKFLRRTRLDELPQFINILRGDMGLIGPRPERPAFVAELTRQMPFYTLRHLIKPGLTGWAQLHRSYYGDFTENLKKLEYDLFYIKNRGLLLDCAILLRTITIVARMEGR